MSVRIEKTVTRITFLHHKARQVMTNGDHKGQIFLSHPHTNNRFFFLLTIKYQAFSYFKKASRGSRVCLDAP